MLFLHHFFENAKWCKNRCLEKHTNKNAVDLLAGIISNVRIPSERIHRHFCFDTFPLSTIFSAFCFDAFLLDTIFADSLQVLVHPTEAILNGWLALLNISRQDLQVSALHSIAHVLDHPDRHYVDTSSGSGGGSTVSSVSSSSNQAHQNDNAHLRAPK